jgi:hypothetical protein
MAVMIPIGTMAKRILLNTEKDDFRNCIVTLSPNNVMSGPRSDAVLFAKVLVLIADAEAANRAITAIVIHIVATVSISVILEIAIEGRGKIMKEWKLGQSSRTSYM